MFDGKGEIFTLTRLGRDRAFYGLANRSESQREVPHPVSRGVEVLSGIHPPAQPSSATLCSSRLES